MPIVYLATNAVFLIPIVAIIGSFAVVIAAVFFKHRQNQLRHQERIKAMELGMAIPPEPAEPARRRRALLIAGILLLSLSTAFGLLSLLDVAPTEHEGRELLFPCIIFGCLGVGFLLSHFFTQTLNGQNGGSPPPGSITSYKPPSPPPS